MYCYVCLGCCSKMTLAVGQEVQFSPIGSVYSAGLKF